MTTHEVSIEMRSGHIGPSLSNEPAWKLQVLDERRDEVEAILAKYPNSRSATLPLLFLVQSVEGYVTEAGMRDVASVLGLTPAEILAVASFYTMLKKRPQGDYLISVCRNISCTHRGGRKVLAALEEALGIAAGDTTDDGTFSLEAAECLATCDGAPSMQINYEDFYNVTPDEAVDLANRLLRGEPVTSVRGEPVRTAKEIARETALTGSRHPFTDLRESPMPTVGGETGSVNEGAGTRPPVHGADGGNSGSEKDVEGTPPQPQSARETDG
ncbi:MAG TPA: NAD(P)H-dependent oxidoreductase subunit E [Actinomycetota bacterium]|nr:NAD(P)H-dependent oxidoreductase subunit E [Actinomycetota bacterium]